MTRPDAAQDNANASKNFTYVGTFGATDSSCRISQDVRNVFRPDNASRSLAMTISIASPVASTRGVIPMD